jgi:hypothetical protein
MRSFKPLDESDVSKSAPVNVMEAAELVAIDMEADDVSLKPLGDGNSSNVNVNKKVEPAKPKKQRVVDIVSVNFS